MCFVKDSFLSQLMSHLRNWWLLLYFENCCWAHLKVTRFLICCQFMWIRYFLFSIFYFLHYSQITKKTITEETSEFSEIYISRFWLRFSIGRLWWHSHDVFKVYFEFWAKFLISVLNLSLIINFLSKCLVSFALYPKLCLQKESTFLLHSKHKGEKPTFLMNRRSEKSDITVEYSDLH